MSVSEKLHTHLSLDNKLGLMLDWGRGRGEVAQVLTLIEKIRLSICLLIKGLPWPIEWIIA